MKHHSIEQLQALADVVPMTRIERLERWARLLKDQPKRRLTTLSGTEFLPHAERQTMRASGSPITVAFEDPVFRAAGLSDDSYGEAKRFFELSDRQLHNIVCHCHLGESTRGASAARRVRAAIGWWPRMRAFFA
ncbi:hypothetical protein Amn_pb01860 (plasmid) [Aminobacter sp. Y103A]|uniref:hypothetical protein n=1 Tax=unclassified Aminobacter TaxID=2644704 RepID=UPI0025744941|nr:hypothetical protein [Aminobacter sp. SS-2016]BBD41195.1 hypothetical protein Amn_pb01860 [Aminobacter sp. SS-2016]